MCSWPHFNLQGELIPSQYASRNIVDVYQRPSGREWKSAYHLEGRMLVTYCQLRLLMLPVAGEMQMQSSSSLLHACF